MRPVLTGLAIGASLATSLIGVSDLGSIASAQPCGGRYEEDCDYDSRDEPPPPDEREYPTMTPEEEYHQDLSRERDAWADAHLAAEKAVATWWRFAVTSTNAMIGLHPELLELELDRREGALVEQVPNGIPGDAVYPVNGRVSVSQYSGAEWIYYECDTNYGDALSGGCVPADRDYDCGELRSWGIANIPVIGGDWMLLDDDGDGWGCDPVVTVLAAPTPVPAVETTNPCDGLVGTLGCFLFGR